MPRSKLFSVISPFKRSMRMSNTSHTNCGSARTNRGERPDKMRHPQSGNSTDVMEGLVDTIHIHNTTSALNCNTNRHQININFMLTVKLLWEWLGAVLFPFYFIYSTSRGRRGEIRAGTHRMCDHGRPLSYSVNLQRRSLP